MKKQTTKPRLNVEAWNNYEQGYANALADVEKIIDEYLNPNKQLFIKLSDLEKTKQEIARRLKGETK